MSWLLRLYPAAWRERYGEEFTAVLASQRMSPGMIFDVLGGAVDAHIHPQVRRPKQEAIAAQGNRGNEIEGDDTMTIQMLQRCAAGGPKLSARDQKVASIYMIVSAVVMTGLYLLLTKIYHSTPAVEAMGYTSFPAMALIYSQTAYLRKRPWLTQIVLASAGVLGMYLFMLLACLIAAKL